MLAIYVHLFGSPVMTRTPFRCSQRFPAYLYNLNLLARSWSLGATDELFSSFFIPHFQAPGSLVTASRAILATFTYHVERLEDHTYQTYA
jgi:hypothetical protein